MEENFVVEPQEKPSESCEPFLYDANMGPSYQVKELMLLLDKWFWAIEDGTANNHMVDLTKPRVSKDRVDKLIKAIDEYTFFEIDTHGFYWANPTNWIEHAANKDRVYGSTPITKATHFCDLKGAAREAFAQEVFELRKKLFGV